RGKLLRTLTLSQVTIAGTGIILGAGIYALIGVAAGITGNTIWLAFFFSSLIAMMTGLSYAELSSIFKQDAGEYEYASHAFTKKIAFIVALLVILTGVFSAATVAIAFGHYISELVDLAAMIGAMAIILFCGWINYRGIKDTARLNAICTAIEAFGLFIIILLGLKHFGSVNLFEMPNGFLGVIRATALVFFAFMGFETIVKLAEETKDPTKTIPKAIVYSLIVSTILYILVSISAVNILDWQRLAASQAPLAEAAAVSFGTLTFTLVAIIALFSTANTVLMTLVTTSRMIYGLAEQRVKGIPKIFKRVNVSHKTPTIAIVMITIITLLLLIIKDLETIAYLNNLFLFASFGLV
ncbi:MAG: APC family permease, partial [Nanoarchaeota archaeon]